MKNNRYYNGKWNLSIKTNETDIIFSYIIHNVIVFDKMSAGSRGIGFLVFDAIFVQGQVPQHIIQKINESCEFNLINKRKIK